MIFKQLFTKENKKSPWISYYTYHIKEKINVIKEIWKNTIPNFKKVSGKIKEN